MFIVRNPERRTRRIRYQNQLVCPPSQSSNGWLYSPLLGVSRFFFSFLIFYTVGRTPWTEDHSVARPLPAHRTAQTQYKTRTQIHASSGIRTQTKIVHDLDRAATLIGPLSQYQGLTTILYHFPQAASNFGSRIFGHGTAN
jgi:hypothetical protein